MNPKRMLVCCLAFLLLWPGRVAAQTAPPEQTAPPMNMDLKSRERTISASQAGQFDSASLRIGRSTRTVTTSDMLTPAELVALQQVLSGGDQTLHLGRYGNAVRGSFQLNSLSQSISELVIPRNVTLFQDFATGSTLNITGDLMNAGKVRAYSTSGDISTANFSAVNIFNRQGALITTISSDINGAIGNLSLSLSALHDIVNTGTISSAGNLTLTAGGSIVNALPTGVTGAAPLLQAANNINLFTSNLVNSGIIAASTGNINIASAQNIAINNVGGQLQALMGSINVRDALFSGTSDLTMLGGDFLSRELNLYSGCGSILADVGNVTGVVNVYGHEAHVATATPDFMLGEFVLTGDPVFANKAGDLTIGANQTFHGQDLAFLASGNILTTGDFTIDTSGSGANSGGKILIVAGATITGTGGNFTDIDNNPTPNNNLNETYIINPGSGGNISLDTSGNTVNLDSRGGGGGGGSSVNNGGSITLIAYGSGSNGAINIGNIQSGGGQAGASGDVLIVGGTTAGTGTVAFNSIDTTGGSGAGGAVTVANTSPSAGQVTVTIAAGNTFNLTGSFAAAAPVSASSTLNLGTIDSKSTVLVQANNVINVNNDVNSPSSITLQALGNIVNGGGRLTAPSVSLTSTAGNVGASGAGNAILTDVQGGALTVSATGAGGNAYISELDDIDLGLTNVSNTFSVTAAAGNVSVEDNVTSTGASGLITITADGNITNTSGTHDLEAFSINLVSNSGNIGTSAANRLRTNAAAGSGAQLTLSATATSSGNGNAFISDLNSVNVGSSTVNKNLDITASGSLNIVGDLTTNNTSSGSVTLNATNGVDIGGNVTVKNTSGTISITAGSNITRSGTFTLTAPNVALVATTGDIGAFVTPIMTRTSTLTLTANDASNGSAYISEYDGLTLSTNTVRNVLEVLAANNDVGNLTVGATTTGLTITLKTDNGFPGDVVLSNPVGNASTQEITITADGSITGSSLLRTGAGIDTVNLTSNTGDIGTSGTPIATRTSFLRLVAKNTITNGSAFISEFDGVTVIQADVRNTLRVNAATSAQGNLIADAPSFKSVNITLTTNTGISDVVLNGPVGDLFTTETISITANQSISGGGILSTGAGSDSVSLTANNGNIGSSTGIITSPIRTSTSNLTVTANNGTFGNGNAWLQESDAVSLQASSVNKQFSLFAGGTITIKGNVSATDPSLGSIRLVADIGGNIVDGTPGAGSAGTLTAPQVSLSTQGGGSIGASGDRVSVNAGSLGSTGLLVASSGNAYLTEADSAVLGSATVAAGTGIFDLTISGTGNLILEGPVSGTAGAAAAQINLTTANGSIGHMSGTLTATDVNLTVAGTSMFIGSSAGVSAVQTNASNLRAIATGDVFVLQSDPTDLTVKGASTFGAGGTFSVTSTNAGADLVVETLATVNAGSYVFSSGRDLNVGGLNSSRTLNSGNAGSISLTAGTAGTGTLTIGGNLSANGGGSGNSNGGMVTVNADQITTSGTFAVSANGFNIGNGGNISFTASCDTCDINASSGGLSFSAKSGSSGGNGGSVSLSAGRDVSLGAGGINVSPQGTSGIGGTISLTAGTGANGGNLFVGTSLSANGAGSGNGGSITLISNSDTDFNIATGATTNGVDGSIQANAGSGTANGGSVLVRNLGGPGASDNGGITIGTGGSISVAAGGTGGNGGSITLQAPKGTVTSTSTLSANAAATGNGNGGTITVNAVAFSLTGTTSANGAAAGTGAGGTINITSTGTGAVSAANLSAVGGGTGGDGGTVKILSGGSLTVDTTLVSVQPSVSGKGGTFDFQAADITVNGPLNVNGIGNGKSGGTISLVATNATAGSVSVNGDLTANGGVGGAGGNITVTASSLSDFNFSTIVGVITANGGTGGNGGKITISNSAGAINLTNASVSTNGTNGQIEMNANTNITSSSTTTLSADIIKLSATTGSIGTSVDPVHINAGSGANGVGVTATAANGSVYLSETDSVELLNNSSASAAGTFSLSAGNNILNNFGASDNITANIVILTSNNGSIGTAAQRINIDAATLAAQATNDASSVYIHAANSLSLGTGSLSNFAGSNLATATGTFDLVVSGSIDIVNDVTGARLVKLDATGNISRSGGTLQSVGTTLATDGLVHLIAGGSTGIGESASDRIEIAAIHLAAQSSNDGSAVFIHSTGNLNLGTASLANFAGSNSNTATGTFDLTISGSGNIVNNVTGARLVKLDATGDITRSGGTLQSIGTTLTSDGLVHLVAGGSNGIGTAGAPVKIDANYLIASAASGNVYVEQDSSTSLVLSSATFAGGKTFSLDTGGNLAVLGVNGNNASGIGGTISLIASGDVDLQGDVTANGGGAAANGGAITIQGATIAASGVGPRLISADASQGGTGAGGTITFKAVGNQADITLSAGGLTFFARGGLSGGDGGSLELSAGRHITINDVGNINVNPAAAGGNGGTLTLAAGTSQILGNIKVFGSLLLNGTGNGNGGTVNLIYHDPNAPAIFRIGPDLTPLDDQDNVNFVSGDIHVDAAGTGVGGTLFMKNTASPGLNIVLNGTISANASDPEKLGLLTFDLTDQSVSIAGPGTLIGAVLIQGAKDVTGNFPNGIQLRIEEVHATQDISVFNPNGTVLIITDGVLETIGGAHDINITAQIVTNNGIINASGVLTIERDDGFVVNGTGTIAAAGGVVLNSTLGSVDVTQSSIAGVVTGTAGLSNVGNLAILDSPGINFSVRTTTTSLTGPVLTIGDIQARNNIILLSSNGIHVVAGATLEAGSLDPSVPLDVLPGDELKTMPALTVLHAGGVRFDTYQNGATGVSPDDSFLNVVFGDGVTITTHGGTLLDRTLKSSDIIDGSIDVISGNDIHIGQNLTLKSLGGNIRLAAVDDIDIGDGATLIARAKEHDLGRKRLIGGASLPNDQFFTTFSSGGAIGVVAGLADIKAADPTFDLAAALDRLIVRRTGFNSPQIPADAHILGENNIRIEKGGTFRVIMPTGLTGQYDVTNNTIELFGGILYLDPPTTVQSDHLVTIGHATLIQSIAPTVLPPNPSGGARVEAPAFVSEIVPGITETSPPSSATIQTDTTRVNYTNVSFLDQNKKKVNEIAQEQGEQEAASSGNVNSVVRVWNMSTGYCQPFAFERDDGSTVLASQGTFISATTGRKKVVLKEGKVLVVAAEESVEIDTEQGTVVVPPNSSSMLERKPSGLVRVQNLSGDSSSIQLKGQKEPTSLAMNAGEELVVAHEDLSDEEFIPTDGVDREPIAGQVTVAGLRVQKNKFNRNSMAERGDLVRCDLGAFSVQMKRRMENLRNDLSGKISVKQGAIKPKATIANAKHKPVVVGRGQDVAPDSMLSVNDLRPVSYRPPMAAAPFQTLATNEASFRHMAGTQITLDQSGSAILDKGEVLVETHKHTVIKHGPFTVEIGPGSISLVTGEGNVLKVRNLWENGTASVRVYAGNRLIATAAGQEIILTNNDAMRRKALTKDQVGRRRVRSFDLADGKTITSSEISFSSLAGDSSLLHKILMSERDDERDLTGKMIKMAACLQHVHSNHGPYSTATK